MNLASWGHRPAVLRPSCVGRNLLITLGAAVAILAIGQTGSAKSSYALWNSSATVDAGSITTGSITANIDITGLSGGYSSSQLARSGAVSIGNNGTVSANYSTNFGWSAASAMTAAITTLAWKAASASGCSSAAPVGATVLSGVGPSGTLAAGTKDVYCLSTTLNPSGVPSDSTAGATFDVNLQLAGWSSFASASIAQTFKDTAGPSAPTLSSSGITSSSAVILWSTSTDDVGLVGYDLYRGAQKLASLSSSDTAYTDSGLSGATTYSYTMVARDAAGNPSAASTPLSVTTLPTPDTQAPTAPSGLVAANTTATGTTISWAASSDNVAVVDYLVYRNGTLVGTVATPSFVDSGLRSATVYDYTVQARDAAGNLSALSVPLAVTTGGASIVCQAQNGQNGKINFTWPFPDGPSGYALYVNGIPTSFRLTGSPQLFSLDKQNLPAGIQSGVLAIELRKTLPSGGESVVGATSAILSTDGKNDTYTCGG